MFKGIVFFRTQCSFSLIHTASLWWRWMSLSVGAVLLQRAGDGRLHPCAFFSRRLSAAEKNNDVGNRELSSWRWRSEETGWRNGTAFVVWTDHKNLAFKKKKKKKLAYVQMAKRLILGRIEGHYFSTILTSILGTVRLPGLRSCWC